MSRILLASPYITAIYDLGKLIAKALCSLGHSVVLWDFRLNKEPPRADYDIAIVFKGDKNTPKLLKSPTVLLFPDDPTYPNNTFFYDIAKEYDYVFCSNKVEGFNFLPLGADEDVHRKLSIREKIDVVFIGTCRDARIELVKELMTSFDNFAVFGNGWQEVGINAYPPQYFLGLSAICSASKIVVNEHYNLFPDTKDIEVPFIGSALLLADKEGLRELYPNLPIYGDIEQAIRLARHYLDNPVRRGNLVKEMQKQAYEFTYKHQVARILKTVEEKLL